MDADTRLLTALAPVVADLVDRHLDHAREWFPHELVPWSEGRDFEPGEGWDAAASPVGPALRPALFVDLLSEDLPHYFRTIDRTSWGHQFPNLRCLGYPF